MMEFAFWVLLIVGATAVICAAAFACMIVADEVRAWLRNRTIHEPSWEKGFDYARHRLAEDAWWFSESPETTQLIHDLAKGVGVAKARDDWREARAQTAKEKSEAAQ